MKIRYRDTDKKTTLVHTLNGSALALARIIAALLENNQNKHGIYVPVELQKYLGFELIR
jgi:seryl-tRNA synthetase